MNAIGIILLFSFLLFFSCLEIVNKKKTNFILPVIACLVFIVLVVFRSEDVPDYKAYKVVYSSLDSNGFISYKESLYYGMEWGALLFMQLIKHMMGTDIHYLWLFVTVTNIIFMLHAMDIYETNDYGYLNRCYFNSLKQHVFMTVKSGSHKINYFSCLFLTCYFAYFGLSNNSITIRTALALPFYFISVSLISRKKFWRAVFFFVVACFFHNSIYMLLPSYIFFIHDFHPKSYFNNIALITVLYVCNVGYVTMNIIQKATTFIASFSPVLSNYLHYMNRLNLNGVLSRKNIMFLLMGFLFAFGDTNDRRYRQLLNAYYFGLVIMLLFDNFMIGYRVIDLYLFFSVPLMYLFFKSPKLKSNRSMLAIFALLISIQVIIALRVTGICI